MEKIADNIKIVDSVENSWCDLALGILIGLLVIALGVVLALYLYFPGDTKEVQDPRATKEGQDPKFRIIYVSPSLFSMLSTPPPSSLDNPESWKLTFLVKNPTDDYTFFYDEFDAKVTYNDTTLWQANVAPKFYQDEKGQNFVDAAFGALSNSYDHWIVDTIMNNLASGHSTKFTINLNGKVQINYHEAQRHSHRGKLQVTCESLEVEFERGSNVGMLALTSDA
ncbi:hypothetical protein A4A49_65395, partial [Nicotiana attenuata]